MADKPVIFLAFANDRERHLHNLPEECRQIRDAMQAAKHAGLIDEIVERANVTVRDIFDVFEEPTYRGRIAVFHYGGHANDYQLLLESASDRNEPAYAAGLASYLGQQRSLALAFLNGCSTAPQARGLLEAGVPAVIATSQRIKDDPARAFAQSFYALLGQGEPIKAAFDQTVSKIETTTGGQRRCLEWGDGDEPNDRGAWELHAHDGGDAIQWSLPKAANSPLFGLPDLPADITAQLPAGPFRHLRRFEREHAEIFFGRGQAIRDLYFKVTTPGLAPIILLHGQTGVGKSSLLEAGLLPRLESAYAIRSLRRDEKLGLLGTVVDALKGSGPESNLRNRWIAVERDEDRPLLVVLDQVEEVFTRPCAEQPDELGEFIEAVHGLFGSLTEGPRGCLLLGLRKEWHPEIRSRLTKTRLDVEELFLERLDENGIVEAVEGVWQSERLRTKFDLEIEEGLARTIAENLSADRGSAITPTLQILLSKMWRHVCDEPRPQFNRQLYVWLRREGLLLGDFVDQQLAAIRDWNVDVSDSGLDLDVLAFHTTPLATSGERTSGELRETYHHLEDVIPDLLQKCNDLYLLVDSSGPKKQSATRLAHDTLAPFIRARFEESEKPGQRARRILESTEDWKDGETGEPLGVGALRTVEDGARGTRVWSSDERRLIEASRTASRRKQRIRKAARVVAVVAIMAITITGGIAFWQWDRAEQNEIDLTEALRLSQQRLAINYIERGVSAFEEARPTEGLGLLYLAYDSARGANDPELSKSARSLMAGWTAFSLGLCLAHEGPVLRVAFSPDGRRLATASEDQTARLWDAETGAPAGEPMRHENRVTAVAFSPDGSRLATASWDQTARLWDAETGAPAGEPMWHENSVNAVAFSPDGRRLATASDDDTARLWDAETGAPAGKPMRHEDPVTAVAFSPDGRRLATASGDQTARLWDAETGAPAGEPMRHEGFAWAVAFSPDGSRLATAGYKTARLWDAETGAPAGEPMRHAGPVYAVVFSPDGSRLATASRDQTARLWDAETGAPAGEPMRHEGYVYAVAFSPDGSRLATASDDQTARLWDAETGAPAGEPMRHEGFVWAVAFSPDGSRLATASWDQTARLWDTETGAPIGEPMRHEYSVNAVAFSPHGSRLATASWDQTARLWDAETGAPAGEPMRHGGPVNAVAFNPDGSRLATASGDGTARLWDAETGAPAGEPMRHENSVNAVAFSPDGRRLATASMDQTARLWDAETREPIGKPMRHEGGVSAVAFSPDGRRLATESGDGTARLWDAETREPIGKPMWHAGPVYAVAFSPDGRRLATASGDGTARLWDAQTGAPAGEPMWHAGPVYAVAFSPDGRRLATASEDETARLWDAGTGAPAGEPMPHAGQVSDVAFSPDGSRLATASWDQTARLWDAETGAPAGNPMRHEGYVYAVAFNPDGSRLATASGDTARVWPIPSAWPDHPERLRTWVEVQTVRYINEDGTTRRLTLDEWMVRRRRLDELGGPLITFAQMPVPSAASSGDSTTK